MGGFRGICAKREKLEGRGFMLGGVFFGGGGVTKKEIWRIFIWGEYWLSEGIYAWERVRGVRGYLL